MSTTYLSPRSSTVMVDRAWAQSLGLNEIGSARRVGNFYRLPRVAYLRALQQSRTAFDSRACRPAATRTGRPADGEPWHPAWALREWSPHGPGGPVGRR